MSKHDLKGIDLSKVGNNKNVDYTFKDYLEDTGYTRTGGIQDLAASGIFLNELEPITPEVKPSVKGKVAQFLFGNPGPEQELVDGKLVSKMRQKGLGRFTSGLSDALTLNLTDFDQRGGGFLGLSDVNPISGLGGKAEDYILPNTIKEIMDKRKKSKEDEGSKNPVDNIPEIIKAEKDYQKEMAPFNRRQRVLDSAMEFLNYTLTSPKIFKDLRRESDYVQNRLLQAELRKQSFPNEVQKRSLAGSTAFAQEAKAMADQYLAAVEGAKAGVFPRNVSFSA